jgi:hypothetical protein
MEEITNLESPTPDSRSDKRVIHIVVGHGLRTYFLNTVRSLRMVAPDDEILVVDNASPDQQLRSDLIRIAHDDPKMRLMLRESNSLINGKVGGLYDAYREAFTLALAENFDYAHIVQGDMQIMWWDVDVLDRAAEIFAANPDCVNIFTCFMSSDRKYGDWMERSTPDEPPALRNMGLTDTGLYDLDRWTRLQMSFDNAELEHGRRYFSAGLRVIFHPWPTDAQIPWPAVIRNGIQQGREVTQVKPFLLKPMTVSEIERLKARNWSWLEDVCIPWGWTCLTPMWTTDVNPDYLAIRREVAKRVGLRRSIPRWERRGLDNSTLRLFLSSQSRPPLKELFIDVPAREVMARVRRKMKSSA